MASMSRPFTKKRPRAERVSQIKWSCVHFRDFSRRFVKGFRFKKLTQLLKNNLLVFFSYYDMIKMATAGGLRKRWAPICRIYQNIRDP